MPSRRHSTERILITRRCVPTLALVLGASAFLVGPGLLRAYTSRVFAAGAELALSTSSDQPARSQPPFPKANSRNDHEVLRYALHDRYVRDWLTAGPLVVRVTDVAPFHGASDDATKRNVLNHYYRAANEVIESPVEGNALSTDAQQYPWTYCRTGDDNAVTFSQGGGCIYLKSWAYASIDAPAACSGQWEVAAHGPVDVWVNGEHVLHQEELGIFVPVRHAFTAALHEGRNDVLVRFEVAKIRVGVFGFSLRLPEEAAQAAVVLPTTLPEAKARQQAAEVIRAAYLDREVYLDGTPVVVHWNDDVQSAAPVVVELRRAPNRRRGGPTTRDRGAASQDNVGRDRPAAPSPSPEEKPLATKTLVAGAGATVDFGPAAALNGKRFTLRLLPGKLSDPRVRALCESSLSFATSRDDYPSISSDTTFEERAAEVIERAAESSGFHAEIAKMALGRWGDVRPDAFAPVIAKLNRRNDTSDFDMAVLAGAMVRYGNDPAFPPELKRQIEDCMLNFKYWCDEPGKDVMWFWSENHQIAFHAAEIMAGQAYPDKVFTNAGQTGRWHRANGDRLALDWLRRRAEGGFHEWDSNVYFSVDLLALAQLADLAENDEVRNLASVVLTKMMLTIALNSQHGVFGSTHARTYPSNVKSGRADGTNGATWLFWGVGVEGGGDMKSTLPLALMTRYRLPDVVRKIALDDPVEFWNRERQGGVLDPAVDRYGGAWEVNKATYRTHDYMLCSAQDFRRGLRGNMQHIWQATLTPDAIAFVTQPPFVDEHGSPNYWVGNLVLPRVAQWKDLLIDVRNFSRDPGMGFTHAYVPMYGYDEEKLEDGWFLGRAGDGYIALRSKAGIEVLRAGRYAYRELRSRGTEDVWICQMGSRRQDGDFSAFCEKVKKMPIAYDGLKVKLTSLRGDEIAFGWDGPLTINGRQQPLKDFPHYDNPYFQVPFPAKSLPIAFDGERIELKWDHNP